MCYNKTENRQFTATNHSVLFIPEVIKGSPVNPYSINLVQKVTDTGNPMLDNLKIYPNPVHNTLYLDNVLDKIDLIEIFNNLGSKVFYSSKLNKNTLDVSFLKPGTYIIRMKYNGAFFTHRLIKE